MNYINYASPNIGALDLVDPAVKDNPSIYLRAEVRKNLFADTPVDPDLDRLRPVPRSLSSGAPRWMKLGTGKSMA